MCRSGLEVAHLKLESLVETWAVPTDTGHAQAWHLNFIYSFCFAVSRDSSGGPSNASPSFVSALDSCALEWHPSPPRPHPSRLSLSTEETTGPRRGAHVQLLLFLRPSVLVTECSPNISLTSAETLPQAFAVVLTKYRNPIVLSHGISFGPGESCCHRKRHAVSLLFGAVTRN